MTKAELLQFYTTFTPNTDPGEYGYLFYELPQGLPELCRLIKCQLIHPTMIKKVRHALTDYTRNEDEKFYTVADMLDALVERNADGLTYDRLPSERLLISCRFHSLLLISMLRSRGIPVRSRVGFASYLSENGQKYIDHWICEVWEQAEKRWIRVDPDWELVDICGDEFLLAGDAWLMARDKEINPQLFGVKKSWGMHYIRNNLCYDLNAVLGNELGYWDYPPLCQKEMDDLDWEELQLLDEIALYLQDPDENYAQLQALFSEHDFLHFKG
ncbi:transglutaminase-like enzyme, predicted cysteine protease [Brevibacillus sp. CF112]|uniref:transglutaminase domain-containing protein n=1 Tax=Brevibacillus TaxID=55080 RepID=UPI000271CCCD|nr:MULTISPECIES: transglutaminase domain-containing protein [Brevibacillus]EJL39673.1 transglutaminase-like enzyme, predicted cysteine protease [Brevibacillus sp. CF112]